MRLKEGALGYVSMPTLEPSELCQVWYCTPRIALGRKTSSSRPILDDMDTHSPSCLNRVAGICSWLGTFLTL